MYGSIAAADTYHTARGNTAWTGADALKTAALVRATDYIDGRYRWRMSSGRWESMFPGVRTAARAQDDEWPRTGATDYEGTAIPTTEIPIEVDEGTYQAALRELVTPGVLSPDFVPGSQATEEEIFEAVRVKYRDTVPTDNSTPNRPVIPEIDEILAPLLIRPYVLPAVLVV